MAAQFKVINPHNPSSVLVYSGTLTNIIRFVADNGLDVEVYTGKSYGDGAVYLLTSGKDDTALNQAFQKCYNNMKKADKWHLTASVNQALEYW